MATPQELEQWRRGLRATFPILGGLRRRWAVTALASRLADPEVIPLLVEAHAGNDTEVASRARAALEGLPPGPARDALCDAVITDPAGPAARICAEKGMRPSDHERACLFLFVTRQLDAYFHEDFEFQNLRLEYERADAAVRAYVMDVVRSGDRRCAGFIGTRKALAECSEVEIKLAIDSWLRHQDWPRLFRGFL